MKRPPANPLLYSIDDPHTGGVLSMSVPWDADTLALQDATMQRDENCRWDRLTFGLGEDGTPESSPTQFVAPVGTSTVTAADFAAVGLNTRDELLELQVTAYTAG